MEQEKSELCALFHGRVQGVFFRATAEHYANELGIVGYIENLSDGSVRMVAQGKKADLEKLLENLKCHPGEADIHRVDFNYSKINTPYRNFSVKR